MAYLPYAVVAAEINNAVHPSDPRHLVISTFEYADGAAAQSFAASLVESPAILAVTVEGPGGSVVFDYAART